MGYSLKRTMHRRVVFRVDWGKASYEDRLAPGRGFLEIYTRAKILSEQAVWQFNEEHPELDIAVGKYTSFLFRVRSAHHLGLHRAVCFFFYYNHSSLVCPPLVYGPPILPLSKSSLGSLGALYKLIVGEPGRPLPSQLLPFHVDVRDLARAHVRALELPPLPAGADRQQRRFLVVSPDVITWDIAVQYLCDTRPALRGRLPTLEKAAALPGPVSKNDTTRAKEVLGITEYVGWQKTFEDTLDALLEAEKHWARADSMFLWKYNLSGIGAPAVIEV